MGAGKHDFEARRRFLKGAGLTAVAATGLGALAPQALAHKAFASDLHAGRIDGQNEPFYGAHQGGIITPQQQHSYFAAFELTSGKRDDLIALLNNVRLWRRPVQEGRR
jgi:deferrochelatase/peroxidase EfeB